MLSRTSLLHSVLRETVSWTVALDTPIFVKESATNFSGWYVKYLVLYLLISVLNKTSCYYIFILHHCTSFKSRVDPSEMCNNVIVGGDCLGKDTCITNSAVSHGYFKFQTLKVDWHCWEDVSVYAFSMKIIMHTLIIHCFHQALNLRVYIDKVVFS